MTRAAVGSWVLILVFSAFVVSSGLWGAAERGAAVRQAPPTPPPVGTCTLGLRAPQLVPCDGDHDGEIVLAWTGDSPTTPLDPTREVPEGAENDPQLHCQQAAEDYVGVAGPVEFSPDIQWYPTSVQWQTALSHGPARQFVADWSWSACLIRSYGSDGYPLMLTQSVRDAGRTSAAQLPDSWRLCIRTSGYWFESLPCTTPHRAELIASAEIALPDDADRQSLRDQQQKLWASPEQVFGELQPQAPAPVRFQLDLPAAEQECQDLVEAYLGGSAGSRDDLLAVMTYESLYYGDRASVDPAVDLPVGVYGSCTAEVVGERDLVGSVAGIGSGPLPFG